MVANGLLYWGPWMCACQLSLYGHICLGPGGDFHGKKSSVESRLVTAKTDTSKIQKFELRPGEILWLRGASGAGKSLCCSALAGLWQGSLPGARLDAEWDAAVPEAETRGCTT